MALIVSSGNGGQREPLPTGTVTAVISNVYDMGMQPAFEEGKFAHKLVVLWELAKRWETGDLKGKPMTVTKWYTASLHEKAALTQMIESLLGKALTPEQKRSFDVEQLITRVCLLSLKEKSKPDGSNYTEIAGVMQAPPGVALVPEYPRDWVPKFVATKRGDNVQY